ncbi:MAG: DUF6334 family protein [Stenotrophomonas sp.]
MIQLIRQACNDGGKLEQVLESSFQPHSRLIDGLELRFETLTLCITAVAEDDTVALSLGSLDRQSLKSSNRFLSQCLGKSLQWAWLTTNQQGYTDGIRLEFQDQSGAAAVILDIVVAASVLNFYKVEPIEL